MEKDYAELLSKRGFSGLPKGVKEALRKIEEMPGDPASAYLRRQGFTDIRPEGYYKGRGVYTNEKTPGIVYKIGVGHNAWQNDVEKVIWETQTHPSYDSKIPKETLECLTPIFASDDSDGECHWLIMPEAEMGVATKEQGVSLMEKMLETGWVVTDHHRGNIGIWNGEPLFVDYGQLKPKRFLQDNWREAMDNYDWSRVPKGGISINDSLASRLTTALEEAEGTKKVLDPTIKEDGDNAQAQVTGYGIDDPDEPGEVATTLMLSANKVSETSVGVFNRLVMVDGPDMRFKAEELADYFGGSVMFGPSHFENPGDYIAAHFKLGEVDEMKDLTEMVNKTVDLYEESIKRATEGGGR